MRAILSIFFCFGLYAGEQDLHLKNLNGQYRSPSGTGEVSELQLPTRDRFPGPVRIELQKENETFQIQLNGEALPLDNSPEFLLEMRAARVDNFSFTTMGQKVSTTLSQLNYQGQEDKIEVENVRGNCQKSRNASLNLINMLLDSCLTNGSLRVDSFLVGTLSRSTSARNWMRNFMEMIIPNENKNKADDTIISDVSLDVENHNLSASLKVNIAFNTKIKIIGKSWFQENENQVKLRVDKVKASFLTVTDKFFDEIEKEESESLVVDRPFIYIKLD